MLPHLRHAAGSHQLLSFAAPLQGCEKRQTLLHDDMAIVLPFTIACRVKHSHEPVLHEPVEVLRGTLPVINTVKEVSIRDPLFCSK